MDLISREELIEKLAIIESTGPQNINPKTVTEAITSCGIYNMQKLCADTLTDAQLYRDPGAQRAIQSMLADKIGAGLFEGGAVTLFEEFQPATCQVRARAIVAVIIPENKEQKEKAAREAFTTMVGKPPEMPEAIRKAFIEELGKACREEVIKIIKKID